MDEHNATELVCIPVISDAVKINAHTLQDATSPDLINSLISNFALVTRQTYS